MSHTREAGSRVGRRRSRRGDGISYNRGVVGTAVLERVVEALWSPGAAARTSVWAILDCARDERIYDALTTSGLDYVCLYSGRLPRELALAAPYLVEMTPTSAFTTRLIEMGWGKSWGVFLRIKDHSNLRHHLRAFLRVRDESGRLLIFRYYDPRVLRVYLPTCRPNELRAVFGPIDTYLVEAQDGKSVIEFEFEWNRLHERRIAVIDEAGSA
jgi:hypothetical protein